MNRTLSLFLIGLMFGGGIGFTLAAGNGVTFDGHDHANRAHHWGGDRAMVHDTPIEVEDDAPTIAIMVKPDPMAGHNLHVMVDNFAFSPQNASLDDLPGQGHAHVYANGQKLGRLYGPWMHLDGLPKGEVEVQVTLNSNGHRPLAVDGEPIAATMKITVE